MRVNITLTEMVLYPALVIVTLLLLYWVAVAKKNEFTEMSIPERASPSNYQPINMPGPGSCDHCHLQAQPFSKTDWVPPYPDDN